MDAAKAIIYKYQETQESGGKFLPHFGIPTTLSAAEYTVSLIYCVTTGSYADAYFIRLVLALPVKMVIRMGCSHQSWDLLASFLMLS